jgi:transcriptional regulator with XRE-family HTH domain
MTPMGLRLGNRLYHLMEERELSSAALSDISGVNRETLGSIIRGKNETSLRTLSKLAEGLQMPISDLLKGV